MTDFLIAFVAFILMVSTIVSIHEFGHYLAARSFGLIATHFSVGFGPALLSWKDKRGTEWRIAPFLIGGYVKFAGDDEGVEVKPGQKRLNDLPRWPRAAVVAAGPGINFVLAGLLLAGIAYFYGYPAGQPVVESVMPDSPAAEAGLREGDVITRFNNNEIITAYDVRQRIMIAPGETVVIDVDRYGSDYSLTATLNAVSHDDGFGNVSRIGELGVTLPRAFERSPSVGAALTKGVSEGLFVTYSQFMALKQIVTGQRPVVELSGPVRIAKMSGHTISMGFMPFLYMMAILSIGVGIINLLPIPALDGGHLATYAIEGITGRELNAQLAKALTGVGIVVIILFGVLGLSLDYIALS
ncbi:M50 family metallopeptidase [Erythrobacter aureus]|uniref:PDZ domain-containing protein n=1 Tax=Erythrobacter aureus TaxID=2182384 RepID=A0A345YIK0_9SPHN|nr:M50 family metallopeptidase [Erythrobacter aureus]AXK43752.1 PDZ domain-containing protein [Erythrobacter aureus]